MDISAASSAAARSVVERRMASAVARAASPPKRSAQACERASLGRSSVVAHGSRAEAACRVASATHTQWGSTPRRPESSCRRRCAAHTARANSAARGLPATTVTAALADIVSIWHSALASTSGWACRGWSTRSKSVMTANSPRSAISFATVSLALAAHDSSSRSSSITLWSRSAPPQAWILPTGRSIAGSLRSCAAIRSRTDLAEGGRLSCVWPTRMLWGTCSILGRAALSPAGRCASVT